MRYESSDNDVVLLGGDLEEHNMTFQVSAKAFSLIIDGLYQDKYGSVIRELSANALDAHELAGHNRPFDIHLPSIYSDDFILRDYGLGLSKEDVIKYFTVLFSSSKDQDNAARGAYGIGCKSPFALADEFSVISYFHGKKTTYTFVRENKSTPKVFVSKAVDTDEESGIAIIISGGEHSKFVSAICQQLMMLNVKPNVYCNGSLHQINYPKIQRHSRLGIIKHDNIAALSNNIYICMGQMLYPVNNTDYPDVPFLKYYGVPYVYNCEIGDISVPPDRERIEITESNRQKLLEIVSLANSALIEELNDKFNRFYDNTYSSYRKFIDDHVAGIIDTNALKLDTPSLIPPHLVEMFGLDSTSMLTILGSDPFTVSGRNKSNKRPIRYVNKAALTLDFYHTRTIINAIKENTKIVISNGAPLYEIKETLVETDRHVIIFHATAKYMEPLIELLKLCINYYGGDESLVTYVRAQSKERKARVKSTRGARVGLYKHNPETNSIYRIAPSAITDEDYEIISNPNKKCVFVKKGNKDKLSTSFRESKIIEMIQHMNAPVYFLTRDKYDKYIGPNKLSLSEWLLEYINNNWMELLYSQDCRYELIGRVSYMCYIRKLFDSNSIKFVDTVYNKLELNDKHVSAYHLLSALDKHKRINHHSLYHDCMIAPEHVKPFIESLYRKMF